MAGDQLRCAAAREVGQLHDENAEVMLHYALIVSGSPEAAQDAVQEVFLDYFVARSAGQQIPVPKAWLFRALRIRLLGEKRLGNQRLEVALEEAARTHELAGADSNSKWIDLLWHALDQVLTPRARLRTPPGRRPAVRRDRGSARAAARDRKRPAGALAQEFTEADAPQERKGRRADVARSGAWFELDVTMKSFFHLSMAALVAYADGGLASGAPGVSSGTSRNARSAAASSRRFAANGRCLRTACLPPRCR